MNTEMAERSYYTAVQHEREMTRMETANKRWFIAFMVLLALFFATNAGWVIYESQFQDVVITQDASTEDGGNNYLNGMGEMSFGQSEADDPGPCEAER